MGPKCFRSYESLLTDGIQRESDRDALIGEVLNVPRDTERIQVCFETVDFDFNRNGRLDTNRLAQFSRRLSAAKVKTVQQGESPINHLYSGDDVRTA